MTRARRPSLLLVDPFAREKGHLLEDDLFLAECLAPLVDRLEVRTSPQSAARVGRVPGVLARPFSRSRSPDRFFRLQLIWAALRLDARGFSDVLFQSFEEVSTLVFMLRDPRRRVHLVVCNNLFLARFERHPFLARFFLGQVLRRAATVFVHCQFEVDLIRGWFPGVHPRRIVVKPFHQIAIPRRRPSWGERDGTILFVGPELTYKRVSPLLELIRRDRARRYRYHFCAMGEIAPETRAFLEAQPQVTVSYGYLEDEIYYRVIGQAALVIVTHDRIFEGRLSGVFCDALAAGTAVVAREIAPHTEFFRTYGPMGFLTDFADAGWCDRLLAADLGALYGRFQENMARCREACGLEAIREVMGAALAGDPEGASREDPR